MQSNLWHILLILSSIKEILKYYGGESTYDDFMFYRLFPKNFQYLTLSSEIYTKMYEIRQLEAKDKPAKEILALYQFLEISFTTLFYKEIEQGIPEDVQNISLEDIYLKDLKFTLNNLIR